MSLIGQGEWNVAQVYEEFKITKKKFYQITAKQRLRFNETFSTAKMRRSILNSVFSKNHPTVFAISIKLEHSDIMYPPLQILHQIFNRVEKYVYSFPHSIKNSPVDGSTACSLIVASASNPDSLRVVKFSGKYRSGKYECDVSCTRYYSNKICSHTVAAA